MRVSVYLPDELAATVRVELPKLNVSAVLQRALADLLACDHRQLVCASCASLVDHQALAGAALRSFYTDLLLALYPLATRGATAEGAARVAKEVALRHRVPGAEHQALPRPSRQQRAMQRVLPFPEGSPAAPAVRAVPTHEAKELA